MSFGSLFEINREFGVFTHTSVFLFVCRTHCEAYHSHFVYSVLGNHSLTFSRSPCCFSTAPRDARRISWAYSLLFAPLAGRTCVCQVPPLYMLCVKINSSASERELCSAAHQTRRVMIAGDCRRAQRGKRASEIEANIWPDKTVVA